MEHAARKRVRQLPRLAQAPGAVGIHSAWRVGGQGGDSVRHQRQHRGRLALVCSRGGEKLCVDCINPNSRGIEGGIFNLSTTPHNCDLRIGGARVSLGLMKLLVGSNFVYGAGNRSLP
jgi:hypothetical protein